MGHRRNRRRCRRRSDTCTRSKPYESSENFVAFSSRWNRISSSTALPASRDAIGSPSRWQNHNDVWQSRTLFPLQHQCQYQQQQIHNQQTRQLQQLHESPQQQQQQRHNNVVYRYMAHQELERARVSAVEAQRIHFFGGEVGDEVSLCAPMLQVVLDLWGGVDYLDP